MSSEKIRVLVADDSFDDRRVVLRHLRRDRLRAYDVREAASGSEALALLGEERPDVLILDQHLGDLLGSDVIQEARERGWGHVAVIVLTGSKGDGRDPLEHGADDFIKKDEITGVQLRRIVVNAIVKARTRAALDQSRQELKSALGAVTERMEFERRLMGVVSHDLRGPLQSLQMATTLLKDESGLSEMGSRSVHTIARSTERMNHIITQLLDLTRVQQSGRFPTRRARLDLCALSTDHIEELRRRHPSRTIELTCELGYFGYFDETAIVQLLDNLVNNAVTHGWPDGRISVLIATDATQAEVRVSNLGDPIPPDTCEALFEPFCRANERNRHGVGLGLYIARQIALAHGGDLVLEQDGNTITFAATLPPGSAKDAAEDTEAYTTAPPPTVRARD